MYDACLDCFALNTISLLKIALSCSVHSLSGSRALVDCKGTLRSLCVHCDLKSKYLKTDLYAEKAEFKCFKGHGIGR